MLCVTVGSSCSVSLYSADSILRILNCTKAKMKVRFVNVFLYRILDQIYYK